MSKSSKPFLKPCPFCNSKAVTVERSGVLRFGGRVDPLGWSACCKKCLCCGPYHDDKAGAATLWNAVTTR